MVFVRVYEDHNNACLSVKTSQLEPLNKRVDTYMKGHQCVCVYEAPLPQHLLVYDGSLHANKSYYCWGEWEKRDGTKYRCKYESDDEGQMWRHYHMHHLINFTTGAQLRRVLMVRFVVNTVLTQQTVCANI